MSYDASLREDRRGQILRILNDQPGYGLNDGVLQDGLERLGHRIGRDVVRADLAWLDEMGLVQCEEVSGGHMTVATLTQRGEDVALGRAKVPGVKRPRPGA